MDRLQILSIEVKIKVCHTKDNVAEIMEQVYIASDQLCNPKVYAVVLVKKMGSQAPRRDDAFRETLWETVSPGPKWQALAT